MLTFLLHALLGTSTSTTEGERERGGEINFQVHTFRDYKFASSAFPLSIDYPFPSRLTSQMFQCALEFSANWTSSLVKSDGKEDDALRQSNTNTTMSSSVLSKMMMMMMMFESEQTLVWGVWSAAVNLNELDWNWGDIWKNICTIKLKPNTMCSYSLFSIFFFLLFKFSFLLYTRFNFHSELTW